MNADAQEPRMDRTALSVVDWREASDREYWWTRSPAERVEAIEINRRIVYGYGATPPRFQRVLEIVRR